MHDSMPILTKGFLQKKGLSFRTQKIIKVDVILFEAYLQSMNSSYYHINTSQDKNGESKLLNYQLNIIIFVKIVTQYFCYYLFYPYIFDFEKY